MTFLVGEELSEAVRKTLKGKNPRMAVAFLGKDIKQNLFRRKLPDGLRVVCDIQMGSTNPDALRELGAPNNDSIRFTSSAEMHAKVYISENGAVIGSINASAKSLSCPEERIEAGMKIANDHEDYDSVDGWFENLYDNATQVDETALKRATALFLKPPRPVNEKPKEKLTLEDALRHNPELLGDVGFIIPSGDNDLKSLIEAQEAHREDLELTETGVRNSRVYFTDWDRDDLRRWPVYFIEIIVENSERIWVRKRKRLDVKERNNSLAAKRLNWNSVEFAKASGLNCVDDDQDEFVKFLSKLNLDLANDSGIYSATEFRDLVNDRAR